MSPFYLSLVLLEQIPLPLQFLNEMTRITLMMIIVIIIIIIIIIIIMSVCREEGGLGGNYLASNVALAEKH